MRRLVDISRAAGSLEGIELVSTRGLKEHPFSMSIYGRDDHGDLVASIRELGVLTPLVIHGDVVISGHRRLRAAIDAGLEAVPCIQRTYSAEVDEHEAILEHNRYRNKTLLQLFREGKALEEIERPKARQRQAKGGQQKVVQNFAQPGRPKTRDYVASALGIGSGEQWRRLNFIGCNNIGLLEEEGLSKVSINKLYVQCRREEGQKAPIQAPPRSAREEEAGRPEMIKLGSIEEHVDKISDNSVGLIITHYMHESVAMDRWGRLASIASRVLVDGGFFVAYVSKMCLAEALWPMKQHLRYYWIISLKVTDSERWVQPLNVITDWVPIVIFTNGEPRRIGAGLWRDSFTQQHNKTCDRWSSIVSARYLIRQFSTEGETVLDPFAHKGEMLLAAQLEGRKAFGYEANPNHYGAAKRILADYGETPSSSLKLCPRPDCGGRLFQEGDELFCFVCGYRAEIPSVQANVMQGSRLVGSGFGRPSPRSRL